MDGLVPLTEAAQAVILCFDGELRLVAYTPAAVDLLGPDGLVRARSLVELEEECLLYDGVVADARAVLAGIGSSESQVKLASQVTALAKINRYRGPKVDGIVLSLTDVSTLARKQDELMVALKEVEYYKTALDRSSIVSMTDRQGRITYVNDLFCEITGYRREELIGKNHRIVNSGYHPREFIKGMWDTILAGRVWSGELRNKSRGGSYHWVHTTIVPLIGDEGEPVQFIAIRNDITDRVEGRDKLARSEARFRALFERAPTGIVVTDTDHCKILAMNPAFVRLTDRSPDELIGISLSDVLGGDCEREQRPLLAGRRESCVAERPLQHPDGSSLWVKVTTWLIPAAGSDARQLIHKVEDITREHENAEKLERQAALARLGEMAAVVAHEVKNPLAGIGGALHVIADRLDDGSMERSIIDQIQSRLGQLNTMVDGLVKFARPLALESSVFVLRDVLSRIAGRLERASAKGPVRVEVVDAESKLHGDERLIEEMFERVISNAARAMQPKGGTIRIQIERGETSCDVLIRDRGAGLSEDMHERIFDPFFTTKNQGVGLGLAQARRIARAHRGDITVASSSPSGTTMRVRLPRHP